MTTAEGHVPPAPIDIVVDVASAGRRLDQFVASAVPGLTRSAAQRLIREQRVLIDNAVARSSTPVRAGSRIVVRAVPPRPASATPEALPLRIVYDDPDLVVVDKPAGMVVHPAPGHAGGTLVNALLHHVTDLSGVGGELRPGIVHRLDKGTSGLMVVAKHDAAHDALARQFRERLVEKEYVALVWGSVEAGRTIERAIGRDPVHRKKMSTRARRGRQAVTRIERVVSLGPVTLAYVRIATGRTHQIRVHLSAIGHPVVGDPVYGGVHRRVPAPLSAVSLLERPFLHASRLAFSHPRDGRRMEFLSPLPPDLQAVLDELQGTAG